MLSLVADSPAERITELAIDGFRAGHGSSSDFRVRGNIHLAHLFDRHVGIWIGKRMAVKYELPLKRGDCYWHGDPTSCTFVDWLFASEPLAGAAGELVLGGAATPGGGTELSVHQSGSVSAGFGLLSSTLVFASSFCSVFAAALLVLDLFLLRSSMALTASDISALARSKVTWS